MSLAHYNTKLEDHDYLIPFWSKFFRRIVVDTELGN